MGTRTNQGSCNDYITEKPDLHHQLGTNLWLLGGYWLRLACSGLPAGFESTCLWSSKFLTFCQDVHSLAQSARPIWHQLIAKWDDQIRHHYFKDISVTKASFGKYLKKKRESESTQQLSIKYFANLCLTSKLFSKVSEILTIIFNIPLS